MRADGQLERADELANIAWYRETNPERDSTRRDQPADLNSLYEYIAEALQLHQGYYIPTAVSAWEGWFPNAWYLKEGMKVENTTIGVTYTISNVVKDENDLPTGRVTLEGTQEPSILHRLKFKPEDSLVFMHSFPKTYAQTYKFNADGSGLLTAEHSAPWLDTITWLVVRKEPGSIGNAPFERPRTLRGMYRKHLVYSPDEDYVVPNAGQWFDAIVQFDVWAQSNKIAERLVAWFEAFMTYYIGVFTYNGVTRVMFWERAIDELVTRWRDDIVNRTIRYYVRTEHVVAKLESKIRSILATVGLRGTGDDFIPPLGSGELPVPTVPDSVTFGIWENNE